MECAVCACSDQCEVCSRNSKPFMRSRAPGVFTYSMCICINHPNLISLFGCYIWTYVVSFGDIARSSRARPGIETRYQSTQLRSVGAGFGRSRAGWAIDVHISTLTQFGLSIQTLHFTKYVPTSRQ